MLLSETGSHFLQFLVLLAPNFVRGLSKSGILNKERESERARVEREELKEWERERERERAESNFLRNILARPLFESWRTVRTSLKARCW